MEANGIITRMVFATVPPTVEYTLTNKGEKLLPIIVSLHHWGQELLSDSLSVSAQVRCYKFCQAGIRLVTLQT